MNQHSECGKCGSRDLFAIPPTPGDHSHIVVGERRMRNVGVFRYVCTDCGYVEEWVNNLADLKSLKDECLRERRAESGGAGAPIAGEASGCEPKDIER